MRAHTSTHIEGIRIDDLIIGVVVTKIGVNPYFKGSEFMYLTTLTISSFSMSIGNEVVGCVGQFDFNTMFTLMS